MSSNASRTVVLVATHAALFWGGYRFATRPANAGKPLSSSSSQPSELSETAPTNSLSAEMTARSAAGGGSPRRSSMGTFSELLLRLSHDLETLDTAQLIKALGQLQEQPGGVERLLSQQLMMTRLAQIDPLIALSYAGSLGGEQRKTSEMTVLGTWTKSDPLGAAGYFSEHADDFGVLDSGQRGAAETIASQWAQADPTAALQWAQSLAEEVRGDALTPIITRLGAQNRDRAIEAINASTEGSQRTEMLQALVSDRGRVAPKETADWVRAFPSTEDQGNAASSLVTSWIQSDLPAAADWVKSLGQGPVRDDALRSLLDAPQLRQAPEMAALWASSIEDDTLREEVLNIIAIRWELLGPQP